MIELAVGVGAVGVGGGGGEVGGNLGGGVGVVIGGADEYFRAGELAVGEEAETKEFAGGGDADLVVA